MSIQVWVGNSTDITKVAASYTSNHDALITTIASSDAGLAGGYVSIHLPNSMVLKAGGTYVVAYAPQVGARSLSLPVFFVSISWRLQISGFNTLLRKCPAAPGAAAAGVTYLGALLSSNGASGPWSMQTGTATSACVRLQVRRVSPALCALCLPHALALVGLDRPRPIRPWRHDCVARHD